MKLFTFTFLILISNSVMAKLIDCMCLNNHEACKIAKVTCSGEVVYKESRVAFEDSQVFGPDDGFKPTVSLSIRDVSYKPNVSNLGLYTTACSEKEAALRVTFFIWENLAPNYRILSRKTQNILLELNQPVAFNLKVLERELHGKCILEAWSDSNDNL